MHLLNELCIGRLDEKLALLLWRRQRRLPDHSDVSEMSLGVSAQNIGNRLLRNVPLNNLPERFGSSSLRGHLVRVAFPPFPVRLPSTVRRNVLLKPLRLGFEHVLVAPEPAAVEIDAVQIESDAIGQLSHLLLILLCALRRSAPSVGSGIGA